MVEKNAEIKAEKMVEKDIENLGITYFYIFAHVFREEEVVRAFLTPLLGESMDEVAFKTIDPEEDGGCQESSPDGPMTVEVEKTVLGEHFSKSARFDVFVTADTAAIDIEMQAYKKKNEPLNKRARAYQRAMDQELVREGMHYQDIPRAFSIFICTYDPFDQGLGQYTFENFSHEQRNLRLDDGTQKIFLYTKGKCDHLHPEIAGFLRYCDNKPPEGHLATLVDQKVKSIKKDPNHREVLMTLKKIIDSECMIAREEGFGEGFDEGHLKGFDEGRQGERADNVRTLLKKGMSVSEIVSLFNFSEEYVAGIAKSLNPVQA